MNEWVPEHNDSNMARGNRDVNLTRDDVRDEALELWWKRLEWHERLDEWIRERQALSANHEGREKRKEDVAYADAWIRWLERKKPA